MEETIQAVRDQVNTLLIEIQKLPEPERTTLLRELRAKSAAMIQTPKRSAASRANIQRINEARCVKGVSQDTREKLSAAAKAAWQRRKTEHNDSSHAVNTSQSSQHPDKEKE